MTAEKWRTCKHLIGSLALWLKAFDIFRAISAFDCVRISSNFPLPLIIELKTSRALSIDSGCARRNKLVTLWPFGNKYSASEARKLSLLIAFLRSLSTQQLNSHAACKFLSLISISCAIKKATELAFIFNLSPPLIVLKINFPVMSSALSISLNRHHRSQLAIGWRSDQRPLPFRPAGNFRFQDCSASDCSGANNLSSHRIYF